MYDNLACTIPDSFHSLVHYNMPMHRPSTNPIMHHRQNRQPIPACLQAWHGLRLASADVPASDLSYLANRGAVAWDGLLYTVA